MEILKYSLLILYLLMSLNTLLKNRFDKLTIYNDVKFHFMPTWFLLSFMFFGFLMFPFYKRIREYRKVLYMENVIRQFEWNSFIYEKHGFGQDNEKYNQYLNYKRYLKLKKLKRKI